MWPPQMGVFLLDHVAEVEQIEFALARLPKSLDGEAGISVDQTLVLFYKGLVFLKLLKIHDPRNSLPVRDETSSGKDEDRQIVKVTDVGDVVRHQVLVIDEIEKGSRQDFPAVLRKVGKLGVANKPIDVFPEQFFNPELEFRLVRHQNSPFLQ